MALDGVASDVGVVGAARLGVAVEAVSGPEGEDCSVGVPTAQRSVGCVVLPSSP